MARSMLIVYIAARARIGPHLLNGHGKRLSDLSGGRFSFLLWELQRLSIVVMFAEDGWTFASPPRINRQCR